MVNCASTSVELSWPRTYPWDMPRIQNTVINENAPTDARALLAYYNLEQYPETHLFYLWFSAYMIG